VLLGPLYVIYKAVSVINLARQLQQAYPDRHFVPVFVLGAEDHDFEEVSRANLFGHTLTWQAEGGGAVGLLPTAGMTELLQTLDPLLGRAKQAVTCFTASGRPIPGIQLLAMPPGSSSTIFWGHWAWW